MVGPAVMKILFLFHILYPPEFGTIVLNLRIAIGAKVQLPVEFNPVIKFVGPASEVDP
jgi:hypothetical protein